MSEQSSERTVLCGIGLSQGCVLGRICLFNENRHSNLPMYKVQGKGVEREMNRLRQALDLVSQRLDGIRERVALQIGAAEAEIFTAQRLILEDEKVLQEMRSQISNKNSNAEAAVISVLDRYEARLLEIDNEYIKERATDLGEVRRRLLDVLNNMQPSLQCADQEHCQRGRNRIIVAVELTPSLAVDINTSETLGFVTERGGVNSHAAILARALGIPAVSGIENIHSRISCGTELLIDGSAGEVIIWPDEKDKEKVTQVASERLPNVRVSGFSVAANINTSEDAAEALNVDAEGIGLYRTEFEFITAGRLLTEEEQAERYSRVVQTMEGRPVTFRMLDVGGDKAFDFLNLPKEENPALGWRGTRLLLGLPELFQSQARAIARASCVGPVRVLYPMIVDCDQFLRVRSMFQECIRDMKQGTIQQGVMFEVPSACLSAEEILNEVDFASVGSNDLIQYLFAVDRNNEKVAPDYRTDHPLLWRLLETLVQAGEKTGKPITLCGEIAGVPEYAVRLRALGFPSVSVSPRLIPRVRRALNLQRQGKE
ncbi:MAG: phosphoenolpyruvate--protein phosphotransferase [Kiritimatiellae bacterium]|nr:phosphoenolpyruvate--protein phosphotransferase [Kiritimatiellia bacterium]MDD4736964.1 phosphoenolpyruvate--protein phosphotransferase [Kiritimatiellia bacterium]